MVICNSKQTLIRVEIGVFSFETNKALWFKCRLIKIKNKSYEGAA